MPIRLDEPDKTGRKWECSVCGKHFFGVAYTLLCEEKHRSIEIEDVDFSE